MRKGLKRQRQKVRGRKEEKGREERSHKSRHQVALLSLVIG